MAWYVVSSLSVCASFTLPLFCSNNSFSYSICVFVSGRLHYLFFWSASYMSTLRIINAFYTLLRLLILAYAGFIKTSQNLQRNYREHNSRFPPIHQNPKVQTRPIVYGDRRNGNLYKNLSGGMESHWYIWRMQGISCAWVSLPSLQSRSQRSISWLRYRNPRVQIHPIIYEGRRNGNLYNNSDRQSEGTKSYWDKCKKLEISFAWASSPLFGSRSQQSISWLRYWLELRLYPTCSQRRWEMRL